MFKKILPLFIGAYALAATVSAQDASLEEGLYQEPKVENAQSLNFDSQYKRLLFTLQRVKLNRATLKDLEKELQALYKLRTCPEVKPEADSMPLDALVDPGDNFGGVYDQSREDQFSTPQNSAPIKVPLDALVDPGDNFWGVYDQSREASSTQPEPYTTGPK
ncbi:MAG: hypothetical protein ACE5FT_05925 [Candidatus Nanoarchaeia archaeon]